MKKTICIAVAIIVMLLVTPMAGQASGPSRGGGGSGQGGYHGGGGSGHGYGYHGGGWSGQVDRRPMERAWIRVPWRWRMERTMVWTALWRRFMDRTWLGRVVGGSCLLGSSLSVLCSASVLCSSSGGRGAVAPSVCPAGATTRGNVLLVLLPKLSRILPLCQTMSGRLDEGCPFSGFSRAVGGTGR